MTGIVLTALIDGRRGRRELLARVVLNPLGITGAHLQIYSFALAAAVWVVVAAVAVRTGWRPGRAIRGGPSTPCSPPDASSPAHPNW